MAISNAGGKFFICTTPVPNTLTRQQYEALNWIEVTGVGSLPESGTTENIISYDTIDEDVTDKAKGLANAGDGSLEVAYNATDPGQIALRSISQTKFKYATARVLTDAPDALHTNTVLYNRGVVGGPTMAGGRNEDFVVETYQFGYGPQREIKVAPIVGTAPVNSAVPTITGVAQVGQTLTAHPGAWTSVDPDKVITYQWEADGAPISGATSSMYIPIVGQIGDVITVVVTCTTAFGADTEESAPTAAVIAA